MAKPEDEEVAPAAPPPPKAPKKRSKLLIIGVPAFVLLMGGGAGAWWYFNQASADAAAAPPAEEEESSAVGLLPLDAFIVNLADLGGRKYLRVTMVLLVSTEAAAKEVEENKLTMSRMRSAIFEVLTTRTSLQLATAEGRAGLKAAVGETAKHVAQLDVKDVLFEEFIVQ
jgi:flagellar FliL protein